jgi:ribosomal-protein-serine acetyltransferase
MVGGIFMFQYKVDDDVELRLLKGYHAEELFRLIDSSRQYLREWLPWVDVNRDIEDTQGFINGTLKEYETKTGLHMGIWYRNHISGVIGYHDIRWDHKFTSIGYWLGEEYQGNGIMTRSCAAMVAVAFNMMELNRVEIRCAEGNHKSRAIPERLGFTREGLIRDGQWLYHRYVDLVVYGLLRREWRGYGLKP